MKQKQNLLSHGKNHLLVTRARNVLFLLFSLVFILSCNNQSKEKKSDEKVAKEGPAAATITSFTQYKISKNDIPFGTQFNKLVLNISLDNLANPGKMSLIFYPVNSQVQKNEIGTPSNAKDTLIAPSFFTKSILISNNELLLADYDKLNIDYLLLTPMRSGANLGFKVEAFQNVGGVDQPITLPTGSQQTKPSPPAPPEFIPM